MKIIKFLRKPSLSSFIPSASFDVLRLELDMYNKFN